VSVHLVNKFQPDQACAEIPKVLAQDGVSRFGGQALRKRAATGLLAAAPAPMHAGRCDIPFSQNLCNMLTRQELRDIR
jgi:hypothetical protein